MALQKFLDRLFSFMMIASLLFSAAGSVEAKTPQNPNSQAQAATNLGGKPVPTPSPAQQAGSGPNVSRQKITVADRQSAAAANLAKGYLPGVAGKQLQSGKPVGSNAPLPQTTPIDETVVPHYFGPYANYANSPMPRGSILSVTVDAGGSGYSAIAPPNVEIVDAYGTGDGATAVAVVDTTGTVISITVTSPGANYTAPMVAITDVTGTGAAATPNLNPVGLVGGIRKFIDSLPQVGPTGSNNLGQYLSIGHPDTTTFPGTDYYEIELVQYTQQFHTDLPATTLRGYVQTNFGTDPVTKLNTVAPDPIKYLGPTIIATRDRAVRIKFTNALGTGTDGDLFLPVDPNVMGAGLGPNTAAGAICYPDQPQTGANICASYTQNRATLHLHGGLSPWISDGTPHQWITPAGETTPYPKGVSVRYVPDMWYLNGSPVAAGTPGASNDPGDGSMTFYYTNQQSARLMFYHDHAYGITRLNVYAGEAAGYLITDQVEQDLIAGTNLSGVNPGLAQVLPGIGLPLIIQDKTFVDQTTIATQDPTWAWGTGVKDPVTGRPAPKTGDLWSPHVFMSIQNPWDAVAGANAFGRWQYGPWFFPPTGDVIHGPVANEYYDPNCDPALSFCEPPMRPDSPTPSMGAEAFDDTPMVNGAIYPYMNVDPKIYRFRVLNAANDRFINLQMYVADPTVSNPLAGLTEVKMVPALANPLYAANFPADGRAGGAPDPFMAGPAWVQIGSEGGFLPAPVVIKNTPITWQMNPGLFNVGNVLDHSLLLGTAERADVLVDFSQYAGKTIILYNDAPAPFPALDPRYDYYTGNPSQMDTGGAPSTMPGYGPNTRTIMQFRVSGTAGATFPNNAYNAANLSLLNSVFAKTPTKRGAFEASQNKIIVPQAGYDTAYNQSFPSDMSQYVQVSDLAKTFTPVDATAPVTINFNLKSAHDEMGAAYDLQYGQMSGYLGIEIPNTTNLNQNIVLYGYASPPVDVLKQSLGYEQIGQLSDGTQIWKIIHNGVDTHPIHFHLFDVQVINRVAWDGLLMPPDANELGWKDTVRMNPLESLIVAMRPVAPVLPFELPTSTRLIEPAQPAGVVLMGPPGGFLDSAANAITVTNHLVNYGWEYVWHCHILSHEEMDMMHSMAFAVAPWAPTNLVMDPATKILTWTDNSIAETGFRLQRATDAGFSQNLVTYPLGSNVITFTDTSYNSGTNYYYRLFADTTIGDTTSYAPGADFPTQTASSVSNTIFVGSASPLVTISGNTGTGGVSLTYLDTTTKTVVSDVTGNYSITVASGWTGTVTPSKAGGNTLLPVSRTYTALAANATAENYSLFNKVAPVNGVIGSVTGPTLSWTDGAATGYEYCVDTSNNNVCNTAWIAASPTTNLSAVAAGLLNGTTYYWQARANGVTEANGGVWWSFNTQPGAFGKTSPQNASFMVNGTTSTTLTWAASAGATAYWYCYDMTNNATCDNPWVRAGTSRSVTISKLLSDKTYYWQVRAEYATAPVLADSGTWFSFTTYPGLGTGVYDDTDAHWTYAGMPWTAATYVNAYLNTIHYSYGVGSTATIHINSQRFKFIYTQSASRAIVDIYVDGVKLDTISEYGTVFKYQQVYVSPILSAGAHTITFQAANAAMFEVDALEVLAAPYTVPGVINDLTAATSVAAGTVDLGWTSIPNDLTLGGLVASYQVRYSASAITSEVLWAAATPVTVGVPVPLAAGIPEAMTVTGLTPGQKYYFSVRGLNQQGVLSALSNSPSAIAQRAVLLPGTYDDTDLNWLYEGAGWAANTYNNAYLNTTHTSYSVGAAATIKMNTQRFQLVYTQSPSRGVVDVYVDAVKVGTINEASPTFKYQQVWYSPLMTAADHTVRFVFVSGTMIEIDAIQVMSAPYTVPGTITNLSSVAGATPGSVNLAWTAVADDIVIGGAAASYQVRYATNAAITTEALWAAATPVTVGVPTPALPGSAESMTVSGLTNNRRYFFAVRVVNHEGVLSALSNSPSVRAPAAVLTAGKYDDTNVNILYSGTWTAQAYANAYNNTIHYTLQLGDTATLSFSGTQFRLIFTGSPSRGVVDVFVDGVKIVPSITETNAVFTYQQVWTSPLFTAGVHTVRFQKLSGSMLEIDAIEVLP